MHLASVFQKKERIFFFIFSVLSKSTFSVQDAQSAGFSAGGKLRPRPVCKDSLRSTHILNSTWFQKGISHSLFKTSLNLSSFHDIVIITLSKDPCVRLII